jgi:hypothetical protein
LARVFNTTQDAGRLRFERRKEEPDESTSGGPGIAVFLKLTHSFSTLCSQVVARTVLAPVARRSDPGSPRQHSNLEVVDARDFPHPAAYWRFVRPGTPRRVYPFNGWMQRHFEQHEHHDNAHTYANADS